MLRDDDQKKNVQNWDLHADFEVGSMKNGKMAAILVFSVKTKMTSPHVLKTAITQSILVQLRSGFLQTSYFIYENVILKKISQKIIFEEKNIFFGWSSYFLRGARGYPQAKIWSILFKNIKYIYS